MVVRCVRCWHFALRGGLCVHHWLADQEAKRLLLKDVVVVIK